MVRLHSEHGLNPTMTNCYFCGESKDILLVDSSTGNFRKAGVPVSPSGEMPASIGVVDMEPCPTCQNHMSKGIILISVADDQESEVIKAKEENRIPNPYRTGGWVVVTEDFIKRIINQEDVQKNILSKRMAFIPDAVWSMLGLPQK